MTLDSSVDIVSRLRAGRQWILLLISCSCYRYFPSPKRPDGFCQPPVQFVGLFSQGPKWPGLEADHSLYSVLRLIMVELCLDSPTCLHGMHRENYTFKSVELLIRILNNAMITLITMTPEQFFIKFYSSTVLHNFSSVTTLSEILDKFYVNPHALCYIFMPHH